MDDFGLKTVTEKELIDFYEIKLGREKQIHDEGRKVLGWSDGSTKNKQKSSMDGGANYGDENEVDEEQMVIDENNNKMFNNNAINIIDMNNDGINKKK